MSESVTFEREDGSLVSVVAVLAINPSASNPVQYSHWLEVRRPGAGWKQHPEDVAVTDEELMQAYEKLWHSLDPRKYAYLIAKPAADDARWPGRNNAEEPKSAKHKTKM